MNTINVMIKQWLLLSLLASTFAAQTAYAVGNDNAPGRKDKITAIVIHAIGGPVCNNNKVVFTEAPGNANHWKHWFEQQKSVSIHYVVDRDGFIANSIDEYRIAWHAKDYNGRSIGIELVNNGDGVETYPEKQITGLTVLVRQILTRHKNISKNNIVRHSDIDSRTFNCGGKKVDLKQDPGAKFPYDSFKSKL
jgi:N-acetyl-anhydromuramyl-L-alanine amidase AmpD